MDPEAREQRKLEGEASRFLMANGNRLTTKAVKNRQKRRRYKENKRRRRGMK